MTIVKIWGHKDSIKSFYAHKGQIKKTFKVKMKLLIFCIANIKKDLIQSNCYKYVFLQSVFT